MENFINLDKSNIEKEHICCAISDKKCTESYNAKKGWLKKNIPCLRPKNIPLSVLKSGQVIMVFNAERFGAP